MKNSGVAAVLSFLISGLGQIYNGHIFRGLVIVVVQLINLALTQILIGWVPLVIVWVWAIFDAYRGAERVNRRSGLR